MHVGDTVIRTAEATRPSPTQGHIVFLGSYWDPSGPVPGGPHYAVVEWPAPHPIQGRRWHRSRLPLTALRVVAGAPDTPPAPSDPAGPEASPWTPEARIQAVQTILRRVILELPRGMPRLDLAVTLAILERPAEELQRHQREIDHACHGSGAEQEA